MAYDEESVVVSVCCITYNHAKYISQCLDGIVSQKTDFKYELIINDDCSTDGTTEIIKEYANKYPKIIKPIFHEENQWSKGIKRILATFVYPQAKGKYIALCEGDDYWIDPLKLQKQVEYMDTHPECSLCFTNGDCYKNGIFLRKVIPNCKENKPYYKPGDYDYSFEEMLGLDYVPTASLMFRTETIKSIPTLPPDYFSGDAYIRLYATSQGYSHNIDDVTCVYNLGVDSSSTTQWIENADSYKRFNIAFVKMLKKLDELTAFKYHTCLDNAICEKSIRLFKNENDWKGLYSPRIRRYMSKKPMPEKLRYYLFPFTKQVRLLFRL